jgi:hypothetical protein
MTENEPTQPPEGVLAEQALTAMADKKAPEHDPALDTPSQADMPRDPNYVEPYSLGAFQALADGITVEASPACAELSTVVQQRELIKFLLARIGVLESALLPFATSALVMSNARMCLIAEGSGGEPAGGTWISKGSKGIQLQPNEGFFFTACDAVGRKRATDHFAAMLARIKQAREAQVEKDAHVENDGTVH